MADGCQLTVCGVGRSGPVELARPQRDGWNPAKNDDFPLPEPHLPRGGGGVSSEAGPLRPAPAYGSTSAEYGSMTSDDDDDATGSDLLALRPPLLGGFLCFNTLLRRLQRADRQTTSTLAADHLQY